VEQALNAGEAQREIGSGVECRGLLARGGCT
jgi:hypothetical protein